MPAVCQSCKARVEEWNEECEGCGFKFVLEPDERIRARYLRGPSLGALLFTQGWTFGARLYLLFALSFIPIVGIPVLVGCLFFGRRMSWKFGGWSDWKSFQTRMLLLDVLAVGWILMLVGAYFFLKSQKG